MAGAYSELQVRLDRDALKTPWGVRLQGGKDFNTPLTVQRVFVGSPADGELHRGDIIVAIENYDATTMLHKQAQDLIKQAGGAMSLRIRRSGQVRAQSAPAFPIIKQGFRSRPLDTFAPKSPTTSEGGTMSTGYTPKQLHLGNLGGGGPNFGVDYNASLGRRRQQQAPKVHHGHHGVPQHQQQQHQHQSQQYQQPPQQHQQQPQQYQQQQHQQQQQQPYQSQHQSHMQDSMLSRVNQSLNQAVSLPYGEQDDYEQKSVRDLTQSFNPPKPEEDNEPYKTVKELRNSYSKTVYQHAPKPPAKPSSLHRHRPQPSHQGVTWKRPEPGTTGGALKEFGHVYGQAPKTQHHHTQYSAPSHMTPPQQHHMTPSYAPQAHVPNDDPYNPSWKGSLKSSGGSKPWEIREHKALVGSDEPAPVEHVPVHSPRVQNVHYGAGGGAPQYQQQAPDQHESDTANVAHLQYNSPMGLYSNDNVRDVLTGQTHGKPGEGTLQVVGTGPPGQAKSFDLATSDVLRMVAEEDQVKKMRGGGGGHGYPGQHQQQHQPQQHHQPQQQQQHQQQQQQHYQQPQHRPHQQETYHHGHMGTSDF